MPKLPREVFSPMDFIIAEVKAILFDQPRAPPEGAAAVGIPGSLKGVETLPLLVPFDSAGEMGGAPEAGGELPAEVVALLKRTSSEITVF